MTKPTGSLNRREALAVGGLGLLAAGSATSLAQGTPGKPGTGTETLVAIEDVTNVALSVSRDGATIAFDLLGILWTVPATGGTARRLTGDFDDLGQPDISPDGGRIVFQSYRTGNFHIWSIPTAGGVLVQHTDGLFDDREPRWSPDGKQIAFSSDRAGGRYAIYLLDVASGTVTPLSQGKSNDSEPCWSPDGKSIAYIADGTKLMVATREGVARDVVSVPPSTDRMRPSAIQAPSFAPDGTLAYTRVSGSGLALVIDGKDAVTGEDLYPFRPAWLPGGGFLYASNGKIRRMDKGKTSVVPFKASAPVTTPSYTKKTRDFTSTTARPAIGIAGPALSPDGKRIVFCALNDLWLLPIGGKPKRIVADPYHKCDPAWSPDGKTIAYSSDRKGTLDIYLHDIASGKEKQLTNLPNQAATYAAWSNDGALIAFLDQEGALHVVDVATGAVQKVYDALWEPGRPSFGPDAKVIAYTAFKPVSARYREGHSEILTVERATGKGSYAPIAPGKSIGVRGVDGPVWSPDGTMMAYVFASTLWVVPVDAAGAFTGAPKQITTEVTDAPSWSGDSGSLLYLSGGTLRIVPVAGGAPRTVPCHLNWALAKPEGRTVIRADRLWDGSAPEYRTGMDVVVEGNRIAAIVKAGSVTDTKAKILDGAGLTLLPGLIDMHTHRQMAGYGYGDRMGRIWLAMGITATRSPGAPAYHMVEDREAIDSGARIAARHYATGEAVDGSRIFYNFMRPVTELGQMELEMERARALSYDMVKTYVRMPHDVQKAVVDQAHAMGMHLSSHYHYPALHSGMDCMEHLGATNRYGYSRTITAVGGGYQDVNGLFAGAKAARTPTLFMASVLLGEDDGIAHDPRIRTLFPPWEYAKLMARVKGMQAGDRTALLANLERQVAQIKQTMAFGWHVINGTDAPIDLVAISLHLAMRGMVRYGMTPHEALLCTTRHSGEFMNEPIGRIAPGMLADMILVEGDPLTKIEDVAAVRHTIANGFVHTPETLMAPFAATPASAVENAVLPRVAVAHQHYWWQAADYVEASRAACCAGHATAHV
ncbi:MAG: amidohydrolase [Sphingobium sp.]|nr:MAG: amidohydrolase [Sphingobium sp.]